jgi:transposase-like protein
MHKYSVQQRQVAVQHFLDHDRCIASTMKALGYLCRATLTMWIDELHPQVRQRVVGRSPNTQHPLEIKNAAVIDLCTRETSAQVIAKKLAVCRPTLYNWKNQLLGHEAPPSMKRHNDSGSVPDQTQLAELQQQVDVLQRNIRRLQLEHDLLKKAWASPSPTSSRAITVATVTGECVQHLAGVTYISLRKSCNA